MATAAVVVDAFPIQVLRAAVLVVRVVHLLVLPGLELGALLLVERECLLEPPEGAPLLLHLLAGLGVHGADVAQRAHAHAGRLVPRVRRVRPRRRHRRRARRPRPLLQGGVGAGLNGSEELLVRERRRDRVRRNGGRGEVGVWAGGCWMSRPNFHGRPVRRVLAVERAGGPVGGRALEYWNMSGRDLNPFGRVSAF